MRKLIGSLIVAVVLVVPVVVSAECAWVLWTKKETRGKEQNPRTGQWIPSQWTEWEATAGRSTQPECNRLLLDSQRREFDSWRRMYQVDDGTALEMPLIYTSRKGQVSMFQNSVTTKSGDNMGYTFDYFCLPDTIDPRAPKGGGR